MEGVAYEATLVSLRALSVQYPEVATEDPTTTAIRYAASLRLKVLNGSYGPDAAPPKFIQDPAFPADPGKQIVNPNYAALTYQPIVTTPALIADANAVRAAAAADVVLVFAAGNQATDQPLSSANPDGVGLYPFITPAHHASGVYSLIALSPTFDTNNPATYVPITTADPLYAQANFADLKGSLIVVVALGKNGAIADYSNRCGVAADWCLAAPGGSNTDAPAENIYSTNLHGTYSYQSGTSEATPFVSGAAAIVREVFPYLTAHQVIETLLTTTTDLGSPLIYGQGLLNLGRAAGGPGRFRDAVFDVDTQGFDSTWSNSIGGIGGLTKRGAGTLDLTGVSTYAGPTIVAGGTLAVDGSIASATIVTGGGTLAGAGRVGSVTVGGGGVVAPGPGVARLTIGGNITFQSGSAYRVAFDAAAAADLLDVSGSALLQPGSTVVAKRIGTTPLTLGTRYTILAAAAGVTGTFSALTAAPTGLAFIGLDLRYDARDVFLDVDRNAVPFTAFAATRNQAAAAAAIDALPATNVLFNTVVYLPDGSRARPLFDLASGEIHASMRSVLIDDSRYIREATAERFGATARTGAWLQGIGAWRVADGDGNAARLTRSTYGTLGGIDFGSGAWRVGLAGDYRRSDATIADRASIGTVDTYELAAFAGRRWGGFGLHVGGAQDWADVTTRRTIAFAPIDATLATRYHAQVTQVFGETGYTFTGGGSSLEPFAALAYVHLHTDALAETGGDAAVTGPAAASNATFLSAGAHSAIKIGGPESRVTILGSAAWKHAFGTATWAATFGFGQSSPFIVAGLPLARDAVVLDVGLEAALGHGIAVSAKYNGQLARDAQDNGARASLTVAF